MATRNLAVMFTDIKGFTSRTSGSTRDGVRSLLEEHDRLLRPVFRYFDGVVVKTIGDAFLVRFDSPTDAVVCGLALQSVLKKHNERVPEAERIAVRVAINVGDVELQDKDVLGEPVNVAARLEGVTEPGEVWFTEAVYLTMNRKEVPTTEIGEHTFKGIPRPVRVFKVVSEPPNEQIREIDRSVRIERGVPRLEGLRSPARDRFGWRKWVAAAIVAALLGPLAAVVGYEQWAEHRAVQRVETLLGMNDTAPALERLETLLDKRPDDPRLRELSLQATREHLARRRQRGDEPAAIRDWLDEQLDTYGHLSPLRDEYLTLHARVELDQAFDEGGIRGFRPILWDLLERYPESPRVPRVAAEVLEENHQIVETQLWPYELIVERAGEPLDPVLRNAIREAGFIALGRNLPSTGYAERAHNLLSTLFPDEYRAWAENHLTKGSGIALVNSLQILDEVGDPRAEEPVHQALLDLLAYRNASENMAALEQVQDPELGPRILEVLQDAQLEFAAGLSSEQRREAEALKQTLRERWSED